MEKFSRFTPIQVPITAGPTRKVPRIVKKRPKIAGGAVLNFCVAIPPNGRMSRRRTDKTIPEDPDQAMKPPKFDYYDPQSLDEALALLDRHGDDAKVLAGGQS